MAIFKPGELKKPLIRTVWVNDQAEVVVKVSQAGVSIRKPGKRIGVFLSWRQIAIHGLEAGYWCLSAPEWEDPIRTLGKLSARLPRALPEAK